LFGWLGFSYLAIGVAACDNALASTALMPLLGMPPDEGTARVITLVVMVIQAVLVVLSTRLVGLITSAAVGLELVIVVVLTVALFVAVAVTGDGAVSNLSSRGITEGAPTISPSAAD
jgi:amino acid permease